MAKQRQCLIVERHDWETGSGQRQLQFVLKTAAAFFGSGRVDRKVRLRMFLPAYAPQPSLESTITVSREYANGTRRTNGVPEMGVIRSSFVFFQETDQANLYDFWWETDKAIVAAEYGPLRWQQARNTQHGRGRLSLIVAAPVPRIIDRL
jgi:hypothetical protein